MFFLPLLALLPTSAQGTGSSKIATAWYAGWHADAFSISDVPWDKYTQLTYAFAETTNDVRSVTLAGSDPDRLPDFVEAAHSNDVKVKVSIGGWSGSLYWSSNVATAENRTLFVQTLLDFVQEHDLDGLDFDWEAPNNQGIGCNTINADDTKNFLAFVQELRKDPVGSKLILSAATGTSPFFGPDGSPITDVSPFSKVLDYIAIMAYDINGPWGVGNRAGPNAPFDDSCAPAKFQKGSVVSAVDTWHKAGMPLNQIVLGVASYGHSFRVAKADAFGSTSPKQLALYPPFDPTNPPVGDAWDGIVDPKIPDECGNTEIQGGVMDFWGLIEEGYLNTDGTPKSGVPYLYDDCSKTPYVYNETTEVLISFDNAESFAVKGKYIQSQGLGGFAMWEAGGDSKNSILLDAIRTAAGF